ncbi:recombination-associated protein RdgC [Pseudohongiella nitratireducens]|uniref:Recombination-associated protein RdgC n=1 Tax=Pseudohongiella nitratireducens TaxID=1768907 RepID=A0A917LUK5_9GAMM|nr:recombination-associated protein RdgC [Pseudohongiella nitratireducens]GGG57453.1 recombination-associated protein RdgC [Pseudohongiella nitratireducens]|tara:strand:+ start:1357 stop:2277 length:921 start_codon:yes stop_codon:yes gene_type:complete
MWFKAVRLYQLGGDAQFDFANIENALESARFQKAGVTQKLTTGWVSPLPAGGRSAEELPIVYQQGDRMMVCLRRDEKMLPSSVVNEEVQTRIEEIEQKQDRKVYRKEKLQLKDEVTIDLLPRAFVKSRRVYAYMCRQRNLLVVNATSAALAEELISAIRDALGSFPVKLLQTKESPMVVMTSWLQGDKPYGAFTLDDECELVNPMEDSNVVRCKSQDLLAEEMAVHLQAGKQARKLALIWNDAVRMVVSADLTLSRLRFEDEVLERAADGSPDDEVAVFDQDFSVMSLELDALILQLMAAFGGQEE